MVEKLLVNLDPKEKIVMEIIQKHTEFIQNFLQNKNSLGWQNIRQNTAPDLRSTTLLPVVIKHC